MAKKIPAILTSKTGKEITVELIRERMAADDRWLYRGIMAIYSRQTEDEKNTESTSHDNGIGFNGVDAGLLSSFAKQLEARGSLSGTQKTWALKKMKKYAGQLLRIARETNGA